MTMPIVGAIRAHEVQQSDRPYKMSNFPFLIPNLYELSIPIEINTPVYLSFGT
jgi:hypothetical protein